MQCIGCGSTAVSERSEWTAHGYRRFRCRDCGKQFNERSQSLLNRTQYPSVVCQHLVDLYFGCRFHQMTELAPKLGRHGAIGLVVVEQ